MALDSLGCKLNQAETEFLSRRLVEAGYDLVAAAAEADIYIVNTCTVTHIADRKSRHLFRMARRRNPDALLVAIGCYAERAPDELKVIDGVGLVIGNDDKMRLVSLLEASGYGSIGGGGEVSYKGSRTRAFVKVQDGCNNFCSYCIVPLVRGWERSLPASQVIAEVSQLVALGYREVVVTGVEIGGYQDNGLNLTGLLESILRETGVERLRISSLQPPEISDELLRLFHDPHLCPHFHLSLQSGSDSVLERMKRRYSTADYEQAAAKIRAALPEAAITTDVIVGFPGETETEFAEGLDFCCRMAFARIHVFPYSPRHGTGAAQLPGRVKDADKKERSRRMLAVAEASALTFRESFLGETVSVLFEQCAAGIWNGLTGNYIKVYTKGKDDLTNRTLLVKLTGLYRDGMWGEL